MRLGFVPLARPSARIRAGRVEIAQARGLHPVGVVVILEHLLDHPLAAPVRVDRLPGMSLVYRHVLRLAEDGRGR
jgi:hypothetical protein